jgi:hypothetical protein
VYFHSARQRVFVDRLGDVGSGKPRAGCTRLIPDTDRDTKRAKADMVSRPYGKLAARRSLKFEWSKVRPTRNSPYLISQHSLYIIEEPEDVATDFAKQNTIFSYVR